MLRGKWFIVSGVLLFLAIGYLGYRGFQSSGTYYLTVSELVEQSSSFKYENLRLMGKVVEGSLEAEGGSLRFSLCDVERGDEVVVVYQGAIPDAFKEGGEVVIEGRLDKEGVFRAEKIITRCPSKYVSKGR